MTLTPALTVTAIITDQTSQLTDIRCELLNFSFKLNASDTALQWQDTD